MLFIGCLTSQQHASVTFGLVCLDSWSLYRTSVLVLVGAVVVVVVVVVVG